MQSPAAVREVGLKELIEAMSSRRNHDKATDQNEARCPIQGLPSPPGSPPPRRLVLTPVLHHIPCGYPYDPASRILSRTPTTPAYAQATTVHEYLERGGLVNRTK